MARKRPQKRRKSTRRRRPAGPAYTRLVADAGVFCLTVLIGLAALFAYFARDLPDTNRLWSDSGALKITLLAADGSPIVLQGSSAGAPIRLADLPPHAAQAILAVEDRNFYHHLGVNPVSVIRALIVNAKEGEIVQGGSTITQQLAKNIYLTPDRTLKRKAQELLLALWLERRFTKDEILTLYLNRVYFGAGAYGIDAASYRYFAKPARDLTLGESAVLAGLLKAPSRYAPTADPQNAGRRGRLVIDQMVAAGFLTPREAATVIAQPVLLSSPRYSAAPYFVDYALGEARRLAGEIDADLIVRTTFDARLQEAAELGMIAGFARSADALGEAQGAAVIIGDDGALRAMIGGRDYRESQFNRAAQARRQPGSAFKPFVYLAAFESGLEPDDMVLDAPLRLGKWTPDNYKSKFYGPVTLREAMARSLNGATIRVQEAVGRPAVRRTARAMGAPGPLAPGPALGLGVDAVSPLELAGAYAPFANGGFRIAPYAVQSIKTVDGDVLYRRTGGYLEQAAAPSSINKTNALLRDVVEWGTGGAAFVPGYDAAGKTGTSQQSRDAWFAGHAGGFVCVVWTGRDDNTPMPGVTGGRAPAMIWREIMARVLPPRYVAPAQSPPDDLIAARSKPSG